MHCHARRSLIGNDEVTQGCCLLLAAESHAPQIRPRPSRNEWAIQGELARVLASSRTSTRRITTRVSAWLVARYKLSGSLALATLIR